MHPVDVRDVPAGLVDVESLRVRMKMHNMSQGTCAIVVYINKK